MIVANLHVLKTVPNHFDVCSHQIVGEFFIIQQDSVPAHMVFDTVSLIVRCSTKR